MNFLEVDPVALVERVGLVPLVEFPDEARAAGVGSRLEAAGVPIIEVALRNTAALRSIRQLRGACPSMVVGAGTVLSADQAHDAIEAGAHFMVSPGLEPSVASVCEANGVPYFPGVATATEVMRCLALGFTVLKFFPAEASGGVQWARAIAGPFPEVRLIPTGGVSESNLKGYLAVSNVMACGGSWITKPEAIQSEDLDAITRAAMGAVAVVREARSPRSDASAGTPSRLQSRRAHRSSGREAVRE